MTTFDKLMLFFGNAALALTGASVVGGLPKWLTLTALAVAGGCTAVAPSIMSSKRTPAPTEFPKP
jgi:hypothetical protein